MGVMGDLVPVRNIYIFAETLLSFIKNHLRRHG